MGVPHRQDEVTPRFLMSAVDEHQTKVVVITRKTIKLEEQAAQKRVIEITRNNKPYKIGVITLPTFYADFAAMQAGTLTIAAQPVMSLI